jgi:hypothetical protein
LYSRAACNQERLMMARVRYPIAFSIVVLWLTSGSYLAALKEQFI